MADVKITQLPELTNPASTDVLPIVDVGNNTTKKVTIADLLENAGPGNSDAAAFAFDNDADTGMYRTGVNALGFTTGGTGRLFIDSSGKLGLGVSSPEQLLHVESTSSPTVYIKSTSPTAGTFSQVEFGTGGANTSAKSRLKSYRMSAASAATNLAFETTNSSSTTSEKLRLDSLGNVGIGASDTLGNKVFIDGGDVRIDGAPSTDAVLQIRGDNSTSSSTDAILSFVSYANNQSGGSNGDIRVTNAGSSFGQMAFATRRGGGANTEAMRLDSSGRLLIGTTISPTGGDAHAKNAPLLIQGRIDSDTDSGRINLQRGSAASADSSIGTISFTDSSNNAYARIEVEADAATGTDDYPGRIKFQTTENGQPGPPTTRLTIKNDGKIGIGTVTPPRALTNANSVTLTTGTAPQYRLNATAADGADNDRAVFGLATSNSHFVSNAVPGDAVLRTTNGGNLLFGEGTTERMRITSTGQMRLAGAGITFNGDTATANELDDYEEGTFTPVLVFGNNTTGIVYNARAGFYVKVGKVVHVWVYINLSSKGQATGAAAISQFPFTSEDINVSGLGNWPGAQPSRRQNETSSNFALTMVDNSINCACTGGAGVSVTNSTFTNGTILEFALCYRAA